MSVHQVIIIPTVPSTKKMRVLRPQGEGAHGVAAGQTTLSTLTPTQRSTHSPQRGSERGKRLDEGLEEGELAKLPADDAKELVMVDGALRHRGEEST